MSDEDTGQEHYLEIISVYKTVPRDLSLCLGHPRHPTFGCPFPSKGAPTKRGDHTVYREISMYALYTLRNCDRAEKGKSWIMLLRPFWEFSGLLVFLADRCIHSPFGESHLIYLHDVSSWRDKSVPFFEFTWFLWFLIFNPRIHFPVQILITRYVLLNFQAFTRRSYLTTDLGL